MLDHWFTRAKSELPDPAVVRRDTELYLGAWNGRGRRLCNAFLDAAAGVRALKSCAPTRSAVRGSQTTRATSPRSSGRRSRPPEELCGHRRAAAGVAVRDHLGALRGADEGLDRRPRRRAASSSWRSMLRAPGRWPWRASHGYPASPENSSGERTSSTISPSSPSRRSSSSRWTSLTGRRRPRSRRRPTGARRDARASRRRAGRARARHRACRGPGSPRARARRRRDRTSRP